MTAEQFLGYVRQNYLVNDRLTLNVLRDGKKVDLRVEAALTFSRRARSPRNRPWQATGENKMIWLCTGALLCANLRWHSVLSVFAEGADLG